MFSSNTSQVSSDAVYVEDVFSNFLYTGNGSTQTITNGIDLAGKGGLVWAKKRTSATDENHVLFDTARGQPWLSSNTTNAQLGSSGLINYNADGFGWLFGSASWNSSGVPYASWTFRKQPKFFDVVTYTGNGTTQNIPHNLGSVPGCIIVKKYNGAAGWAVYHRSIGNTQALFLNSTLGTGTWVGSEFWNNTTPTSTQFSVGGNDAVNNSGGVTYVAYLFAHNAGGFGLTGTDNVISCGSFTADGSGNATVTLGYEPQWILWKQTTGTAGWNLTDTMRGMSYSATAYLQPNSAGSESVSAGNYLKPTATGFQGDNGTFANSTPYIYIAIRRGPMKTPTSGTSVFAMDTQGSTTPRPPSYKSGFPVDWAYTKDKTSVNNWFVGARLTGTNYLSFDSTAAQATSAAYTFDYQNGWLNSTAIDSNRQSWMFRRAPGFFDEVCYTGTGSVRTINHNLGVAPEMMIVKDRGPNSGSWRVYHSALGPTKLLTLNLTNAAATLSTIWNDTAPTASVFTVGTYGEVNLSGDTFVAYLFASCPGVSKVGSYTGNGNTAAQGGQTINCGFTGSARFILIKCTSSAENWYVYDSARGIVTGNDPSLTLNTTEPEDTGYDAVDAVAGGFIVNNNNASNLNTSGQTYIYLAIA